MIQPKSRSESVLSIVIAALMALQSAGGLFIRGLYRESAISAAGWIGNDLVTLVVAVPLLLGSSIFARKGSLRARLIYLGVLYYELYNNMYYLFGTPFNRFFLVYEALFVLSASALALGLAKMRKVQVGEAFMPGTPRKLVGGFMLVPAAILGVMWIGETASSAVSGSVPSIVTANGWLTHLPAIFDLSMIVTPLLLGAFWLWRSLPRGYVAASIVLVQCSVYSLVLIATAPFVAAVGVADAWDLVPLWCVLGAGCILFGALLLGHVISERRHTRMLA